MFGNVTYLIKVETSRSAFVELDVAVKVLRMPLPHDEEGKKVCCFQAVFSTGSIDVPQDIRREMGIWRRMRHRHIVPFFGVANNFIPSRISLVSPWQANGTLTSLLECDYNMNYMRRLLLVRNRSQVISSDSVIDG